MSYSISCTCDDPGIEKITISIPDISIYDDVMYSHTWEIHDVPGSCVATFTATPKAGYVLRRWEYESGGDEWISAEDEFAYTDGVDISIRAVSKEAPNDWNLISESLGELNESSISVDVALQSKTMYRYSVTFKNGGTVTVFSSGSLDTYGYFGTTKEFDNTDGSPQSYIVCDDDHGEESNFSFLQNVNPSTRYYIWVRGYEGDETGIISLHVVPPAAAVDVSPWTWDKSNGNATRLQTPEAHTAVVTGGAVTDFSYLVWNDMVDKVLAIIDAADGEWYDNYASYEDTLMTADDKVITAKRFNSLRFNIGSRYSTGISEVSVGDDILGEYFITLADCINGWIDNL